VKVLSIDGGGIRGIIPATVLCEIERRTGRPIAELFDLIAGTSTGGILACALAKPGALSADELIALYEGEGPRIFDRSLLKRITSLQGWIDERYDDAGLDRALRTFLGDSKLSEVRTPIFVTAYDIEGRFAFFFRSERAAADPAYDFPLHAVARATSAAPTYFEPAEVTDLAGARTYPLIDGGVYAVNPAMCAWADHPGEVELLASLGTGGHTRPYSFEQARGWGQIEWARPLIDVVFDGIADTIDFQLAQVLPAGYLRFQVELDEASDDLDDASPENLERLREAGRRLVRENEAAIDDLCARLTA